MPDEVTNVTTPPVDMGTFFTLVSMPVPHGAPHFSIRDHFAGLVIQGIIARNGLVDYKVNDNPDGMDDTIENISMDEGGDEPVCSCIGEARAAYQIADAMLLARKEKP